MPTFRGYGRSRFPTNETHGHVTAGFSLWLPATKPVSGGNCDKARVVFRQLYFRRLIDWDLVAYRAPVGFGAPSAL